VPAAPSAAPAPTPVAPIAAAGTPSAKSEAGADSYGPVKRGDTLNKIAQELRPESVSLEQMLVALYRENQSAFIDNNMNRLRTGQILKVPSAGDAAQIEIKEARNEIKAQVSNWNAYREQVAGNASVAPAKPSTASNEAGGKISVAKPDAPAPARIGGDQLKIAKSDAAGGTAGGAGAAGSGNAAQVTQLREEKTAAENALKESNSRVKDLEKQITDMRKLMELKGMAGKDGKPAPEPAKPVESKVATATPAKVEPPKAEPAKVEPAKAEPPKVDAKPADTKPVDIKPPETKLAEAPKADAPKPVPKPAVKAPPPPPEPSFMDEWGLIAGGGLASVLGLGGLFAFMSRRKKKGATGNSTSMSKQSSIMPSDLKPNTVTGKGGGGLVDTGNSSFLTDFDKTGPGSIDTDEVDPVAEAEVYIAYGRDAQAEEILKEAMSRDKSRHEITVKLLEIYHARKSVQAFETVAKELKDTIGGNHPIWAKVAAMGTSIDPANALYGGSGPAYAATGAFTAGGTDVIAAGSDQAEKAPPDLDFDLGFSDSPATSASAPIDITSPNSEPSALSGGLDFDLDLNSSAAPASAAAPESSALDFDLALDVPDIPAPPAASAAPAEAGGGFDFDLSSLSLGSADATLPKPAAAADFSQTVAVNVGGAPSHERTAAMNLGGLSLDLDVPSDGTAGSEGPSAVATKLELAKAYIEIGDADGAKEILNEVTREGSPAQKEEARKILAGM
jgi:pilus assembly protein FimV